MSLTAFHVGFGIDIGYDELRKILLKHHLSKSQEEEKEEPQQNEINNSTMDKGLFRAQALKKYSEAINKIETNIETNDIEIESFKKNMGLQESEEYTNSNKLKYGKYMILLDESEKKNDNSIMDGKLLECIEEINIDDNFFEKISLQKMEEKSKEKINKLINKLENYDILTDGDYDYDCIYYLEKFLRESPIQVSDNDLVLEIITYPHTHRDGNNVAVGVFHEITDGCNSLYDEREHKKIMNSNLDTDLFKNLFGKNPRYMIIPNGCNCCR